MTLWQVVEKLKSIALSQPIVNSTGEGNIYDFLNGSPSSKYATIFLTQSQHSTDGEWDDYGFTIFYVDRLVDNLEANRLQIQSIGKDVVINLIRQFCEEYDAECSEITITPFTEKFVDLTAGVYASVDFRLPVDSICSEDY